MFQDLDLTLKNLLLSELPQEYASTVHVLFGPPDSSEISKGNRLPAINLFLYDIKEDASRRDVSPELVRQADGRVMRCWPPAVVDCHYLITAWSGADGDNAIQDEHRLLGAVMKALLRFRELPPAVLQGELAEIGLSVSSWLLQSDHLRSLGEFWQALGGKPRAALSYRVTIQVPARATDRLGRTVAEVQV